MGHLYSAQLGPFSIISFRFSDLRRNRLVPNTEGQGGRVHQGFFPNIFLFKPPTPYRLVPHIEGQGGQVHLRLFSLTFFFI